MIWSCEMPSPMAMWCVARTVAIMNAMATLQDASTRDRIAARREDLRSSATPNSAERAAAERLEKSFAQFDGSDTAYVAFLTGLSPEELRAAGAI